MKRVKIANFGQVAVALLMTLAIHVAAGAATVTSAQQPNESVKQSSAAACDLSFTRSFDPFSANGETRTMFVHNLTLCTWTATSSVSWMKVTPGSGNAILTVITVKVEKNIGPMRVGEIHFPGKSLTIAQSAGSCFYSFSPTSKNVSSAGITQPASVWVNASDPDCPRSGKASQSWIKVIDGASLWGSGPLLYIVDPNIGPPRLGSIGLGDYHLPISQGGGCSYTLSPASKHYSSSGSVGYQSVSLTSSAYSCPVDPVSNSNWLTISTFGNAQINYSVAANHGIARTGKITVGNATHTITQEGGCDYTFNTNAKHFASAGGAGSIGVTTSEAVCPRNAVSNAAWLTITGGNMTTGSGPVNYTVAPNNGPVRTGEIKLGGSTLTVTQDAAQPTVCSYTLSPALVNLPAGGGSSAVQVTASSPTCQWSPVSGAPWLTITNAGQITGSASVEFSVEANNGAPRSTTITVGSKTATINQSGSPGNVNCTFSINPGSFKATADGGEVNVNVTASENSCKWYLGTVSGFVSVINGATGGTGNGAVKLMVQPNAGVARAGSAVIAEKVLNISQDGSGPVANVSSASFAEDGLAPASLASAFGADLADGTKSADAVPLPTELSGSTVTFKDSLGKERQAEMLFVSAGQINYVVPPDVALGLATVTVKRADGATSVGTVNIERVAPGMFSANSTGKGVAAALALRLKPTGQQIYEPVSQYDAAAGTITPMPIDLGPAGDKVYVAFFATGLRYRASLSLVSVEVGGVVLDALYAGAAPGYEGLDQINVLVPASMAGRGEVDVVLSVEGKKANTVKLSLK